MEREDLRGRRERRRSRRLLRAMDRQARRTHRRAARPSRRGGLLPALLVVAALAGAAWAAASTGHGPRVLADLWTPRAYVEVGGRAVAVPDPEPAAGRLLPPVPVTTTGQYAFLHTTADGGPVGYDPCRPVRYVVRAEGEPAGLRPLVDEAAQIVSAASGLQLVAAGDTDEAPTMDRRLIQPERYGAAWAPVLVAWADESTVPELAGEIAGVGGSAAVPGASGEGTWLAAGRVLLDGPELQAMLTRGDGRAQARAIIVHELAHVLGLDHVSDPAELMHPMTSTRTDLGPGDRAGLALLGQVACEE